MEATGCSASRVCRSRTCREGKDSPSAEADLRTCSRLAFSCGVLPGRDSTCATAKP